MVGPDDGDPDAMWSFRSHVVREVAYDSILRRRRPAMHRAVAEALARLEPTRLEENVELLASHFELSDEPALAVPHLRLAVERAEASHSVTGAVDRAQRALGIRDRQPSEVDDVTASWFLEHLGVARMMLGDHGGSTTSSRRSSSSVRALQPTPAMRRGSRSASVGSSPSPATR